MRTEGLKCGLVLISLVFALALSITLLATPVLAEAVISEPSGTTIEVVQGQEFVLSFRLQWDEPGPGFFSITLKWFCPENNPAENFTIVGVSAYFDNGQPINAAVTSKAEGPWDNGTLYIRVIGTPIGDPNDGPFNVDITFLAGSEGFPHIPTDNHPIEIASIIVADGLPWVEYYPPDPVIIKVLPRVAVGISPTYQGGEPGAELNYTVTVRNNDNIQNTYLLTLGDNAGWPLALSENLLGNVQTGESRIVTLNVTVPENAVPGTEDNITVTATSIENAEISDNDSCVANAVSKAEFKLENLYAVSLDANLWLGEGSKLVVKFYTYDDFFENESVFENFAPPAHIVKFEKIFHPENKAVEKVRLDLTADNTENVISTIASFTVTRDDLFGRIMTIKGLWPYLPPIRPVLFDELMDIKAQWPFAPS